jgi:hypothetical protein
VWTDPIPKDAVRMVFAERAMMEASASRPYPANLLEADRRVPWVSLEKLKVLVC